MLRSTLFSHLSNWCSSVGPWSVYQDPAWLAARIVIELSLLDLPELQESRSPALVLLGLAVESKKSDKTALEVQFAWLHCFWRVQ